MDLSPPPVANPDLLEEIDAHLIPDEAALRDRFGTISHLAKAKAHSRLDRNDRAFIARSPFLVIGTQGADGRADVSPRGDPAGFVTVIDDTTLAIPDRPGNNRLDTMGNIFANPSVGLIFMVPGFDDTLRVNGKARVSTAPALLEAMAVRGRAPTVAIVVTVEEIFLHCAKAFRRSALWDPASRQDRKELPSLAAMILETADGAPPAEAEADAAQAGVEDSYTKTMY